MSMHNFIKIFKKFQEIGPDSLFFRIWTSATPRPIPNDIWQSLGLHLVNINMYAKFRHNSPLSSAIFTFSEFSAKPRPIPNIIWQSHWLHLVNINMYAKGGVPPYRKFTKGSVHARNFIILRIMIVWHMTIVFMKYIFSLLSIFVVKLQHFFIM